MLLRKKSHHKILIRPIYIIHLFNLAQLLSWADIQRTQSTEHAAFNCCLPDSCASSPSKLHLGHGAGVNELAKFVSEPFLISIAKLLVLIYALCLKIQKNTEWFHYFRILRGKSWKVGSNQRLRDCLYNKFREDWNIPGHHIKNVQNTQISGNLLQSMPLLPPKRRQFQISEKFPTECLWAN